MKPEDEPYALKTFSERQRRVAMLYQSHIEPLVTYLAKIKADHPEKELCIPAMKVLTKSTFEDLI